MALVFNLSAFVATIVHILAFAEITPLTILVAAASLFATVVTASILALRGR